jgi:hypothetical protein
MYLPLMRMQFVPNCHLPPDGNYAADNKRPHPSERQVTASLSDEGRSSAQNYTDKKNNSDKPLPTSSPELHSAMWAMAAIVRKLVPPFSIEIPVAAVPATHQPQKSSTAFWALLLPHDR